MKEQGDKDATQQSGVRTRVAELTPISTQLGSHLLNALQEPGCVAVISTIVPGFPTDSVVSVPLTAGQMSSVGAILNEVQQAPASSEQEVCIGFHCALPEK